MEDISSKQPIVELNIADCGPLRVGGPVKIITPDGNVRIMERCSICRCGNSTQQPFCDGSHKKRHYDSPHETFV